ncbi:MAG: transposase, partial [Rickettsia endosymbiont of Platyusa sonomae]|nr:transposase [Rickettsia endosymbiont of Platyusa sonomae]
CTITSTWRRCFKKNKGSQSTGRGRKGLGTTIHLAITSNGCINCQLFPAQRQDCKTVEQLWPWEEIDFVVADKGYDNGNIRNFIKSKNAIPVIPYKGVYLPNDSNLTPEDFYDTKIYRNGILLKGFLADLRKIKELPCVLISLTPPSSALSHWLLLNYSNYFVNSAIYLITKV